MDITQILGITGAVVYLSSYALLQLGFIKGESNIYAAMQLSAASMVLISLTTQFNIGSLFIQVSFIALSLYAIAKRHFIKRPIHISDQEKLLADTLLPNLPYRRALVFIHNGTWQSNTKAVLAKQGHPIDEISVLLSGKADVMKNGKKITTLGPGHVIGDITYLNETPATAQVSVSEKTEYFSMPTKTGKMLLAKNADMQSAFEQGIRHALSRKLA